MELVDSIKGDNSYMKRKWKPQNQDVWRGSNVLKRTYHFARTLLMMILPYSILIDRSLCVDGWNK